MSAKTVLFSALTSSASCPMNIKEEIKSMANLVNVYLFGKKYEVPEGLTIMTAMEYAGYELVRGCGCRNGFCGACATIYRIKGQVELHGCLACQTEVQEGMYVATLPFFPLEKRIYDINEIKPDQQVMMQLYPEIYSCIGCNACTKACTQELNVMQYIDCVMCGVCSSRCPAGISHPQVAMLARRLNGKYIAPECGHLNDRVSEINEGIFDKQMAELMAKSVDSVQELKDMYNNREIEK